MKSDKSGIWVFLLIALLVVIWFPWYPWTISCSDAEELAHRSALNCTSMMNRVSMLNGSMIATSTADTDNNLLAVTYENGDTVQLSLDISLKDGSVGILLDYTCKDKKSTDFVVDVINILIEEDYTESCIDDDARRSIESAIQNNSAVDLSCNVDGTDFSIRFTQTEYMFTISINGGV